MPGEALQPTSLEPTSLEPTPLELAEQEPDRAARDRVDPKELVDRLMLARADMTADARRMAQARSRLRQNRERWQTSESLREASYESAYIRLLARFESQPVIEQAKGMLMAQGHCSADDAFEILRRASQRENVAVREIAARIVKRAITEDR